MTPITSSGKRISRPLYAVKLAGKKNSSLAVIDSKIMAMHSDTAMKLGKQARGAANAFEPADFFDPYVVPLSAFTEN